MNPDFIPTTAGYSSPRTVFVKVHREVFTRTGFNKIRNNNMTPIHTPTFLDFSPSARPHDDGDRTVTRRLMLIFGFLSMGIVLGGTFYFLSYERHFRSEVEHQLSAIAELKVNNLVQWRNERLDDANFLYRNPPLPHWVRKASWKDWTWTIAVCR